MLVGNYRRSAEALRANRGGIVVVRHREVLEMIDGYMRNHDDPEVHRVLDLLRQEKAALDSAHTLAAQISEAVR